MYTIKQPSKIVFGKNSAREYNLPKDSLVITSQGAKQRGWLEYLRLDSADIFDDVESNPSMETVSKITSQYINKNFSTVIGLGGGSVMDVAKFVGSKLNKLKIMIPTIFGSGSEVTRISVLKLNGKKSSFHDDRLFADVAILDSFFIENSPLEVLKYSLIDACAQSSEAYDSKIGNPYTRFLCKVGFDFLEKGILTMNKETIVTGTLLTGLGFGNSSTTLGHALSYVYSNEGYAHGHTLAHTTMIAHEFNTSQFFNRFLKIVRFLGFKPIKLKKDYHDAADLIMTDKKHLDNNPKNVSKHDIISLLKKIDKHTIL